MNVNPDFYALLAYTKRYIATFFCRAEQILLDIFCDTPAEYTPVFIMNLQTRYMNWRIRHLERRLGIRHEPFWTVIYPDSRDEN